MSTITPNLEIRDAIIEEGGTDAYKCYQCGKCMSICPWFLIDTVDFPVYQIPQGVKLGTVTSSEDKDEIAREVEEMFRCLGCEACTTRCPLGVSIPHVVRAVRRMLVEYGAFPPELKSIVSKIYNVGNPYGEPREKRTDWASGQNVPTFQPGMEFLYFSCCLPAYDARGREVACSTTKLFKEAGVSYGILQDESCCSEAIRRVGAEKVFQQTAKANIDAFHSAGVQKIVTTSPHCYSTFKTEYPELGADFEVVHQTELLSKLIEEGRIVPRKPLDKRVVYHDPCTLGRQNGIYDEPRRVLASIPGLEMVEIENFAREFSICCGGGSGGMWLDWPMDQRVSNVRIRQVLQTGADILAVACPYCLQMFEDTVKSESLSLEVRDVSELLAAAL
jgi:Fe-S oxidoreductase